MHMKNIKVDFFSESKKWPRRTPKIKTITKKTINKMSSYFKREHKFELNIILTDKSKINIDKILDYGELIELEKKNIFN